jgi:hypothetical protein
MEKICSRFFCFSSLGRRIFMRFPTKEQVEQVRKMYVPGARVVLVSMDDPHSALISGDKGTVRLVDDTSTVHVNWDCGSSLGVVFGVDSISPL